MSINFGVIPVRSVFTLSSDADFYQVCRTSDASNFPVATVLNLKFLSSADAVLATWTATIVTSTATFNKTAATVAALLLLLPVQGRLYYNDGAGGPTLLLAQGDLRDVSP